MSHILHLTTKVAATRTKPASAGYQTLDLPLVRAGGLRLCSQASALGGSADLKHLARDFSRSVLWCKM